MRAQRFDLRRLAAIYLGGAIGALARVGLAEAAPRGPGEWPLSAAMRNKGASGGRSVSAPAWIAVALAGGGAAVARFLIDATVTARTDHPFPLGILAINLAGTLALGLVAGAGAALEGEALVVVAGGGIGSFTTFSTWMLDSHRLSEAGHTRLVWLNLGLSLVAGFAAAALGHWLGESL